MAKKSPDDLFEKSTMTFGEHLEELRVCLFRSVIGIALGCLVGFFVANSVVRFFQSPLERAMERYYVDKALTDFGRDTGGVPLEVKHMIVSEGLIPEAIQIDIGQLAKALRLTYPEHFAGLDLPAYWFTSGDFRAGGAEKLCRELVAAKTRTATPAGKIWALLTDEQRQTIEKLATSSTAMTQEQTSALLDALNHLAGRRELHESSELASVSGPDVDPTRALTNKLAWLFGTKTAAAGDTVSLLRDELKNEFDPEKSRRLNKLLIARVFPESLRTARLNLLSLDSWRQVRVRFQVLNAQEAFMIWMKAALMTGLVIASPYVFFQIWLFVAAGLYPHEKGYIYIYLPISVALFFGGASLAFAFVFDPVLDFLFTFNKGMNADFDPRIGEWLSFVLILPLGFGISFQLPLVMLFVNRLGLVSVDLYIKQWRIAILIIFVVAMVLTPADPVSMLLMAAPLCFLYLLGILMCQYMPRGRSPFDEAYEP
jgi:sec-independent protein translocase protein TatC